VALTIVDDDSGYLRWIADHPDGFVVNTFRKPNPSYLILHRSTCGTITGTPARGKRWTTGDFAKICSTDRVDLARWAREHNGELHPCGLCHP
jgi:hypothetical protein